MLIIIMSLSSCRIATFSTSPEYPAILFLKGSHWTVYFSNMFKFPAVSSRFVQTNKVFAFEAVSHNKRTEFLNVVLVLSLWPQLFAAQMICHCCCSPPVVTIVISSIHFRATSANHCFLVACFHTSHTNQDCKRLKFCSSTQLLTFLIRPNRQNFLCFICSPFENTFFLIAHAQYTDSP